MNDLKNLMADVATERLAYAQVRKAGDAEADKAFEQGITAAKICIEMTKMDDTHEEQVEQRRIEVERQDLEREKQIREEELKRKQARNDRIIKGIEIAATVILVPVVGLLCNKAQINHVGKLEQFEVFTSTAGRSAGKMFKWW